MEDNDNSQKKTRLVILGVSGLLLLGCAAGWVWFSNKKEELYAVGSGIVTSVTNQLAPQPVTTASGDKPAGDKGGTPDVVKAMSQSGPLAPMLSMVNGKVDKANERSALVNKQLEEMEGPEKKKTLTAGDIMSMKSVNLLTNGEPMDPEEQAPPGKFPSTGRRRAKKEAQIAAGRQDPMLPIAEQGAWPQWSRPSEMLADAASGSSPGMGAKFLLPPPGAVKAGKNSTPRNVASAAKLKLVPPPPPMTMPGLGGGPANSGQPPDMGLPIAQLPMPPEKPSIMQHLKLSAIIGNKAIIAVPYEVRFQNKWPAVISLGPGEQFESIRVVSVDPDSVTIDEDGERVVKSLASIR